MPPHTNPWAVSLALATAVVGAAAWSAWATPLEARATQAVSAHLVQAPASVPPPTVSPEPRVDADPEPLPAVEPVQELPDPPPVVELTDLELFGFDGDDCPGCGMG